MFLSLSHLYYYFVRKTKKREKPAVRCRKKKLTQSSTIAWQSKILISRLASHFPAKSQLIRLLKSPQCLLQSHADRAGRDGPLVFPKRRGYLLAKMLDVVIGGRVRVVNSNRARCQIITCSDFTFLNVSHQQSFSA